MTWRRIRRSALSLIFSVGVAATAVAVSLAVVALVGNPPVDAASAYWEGAFGGTEEIGGTLQKTIPLSLVALGWIVAYSAYRVNVGFEGQIVIGGILAAVIALKVPGLPTAIHLPLGVVAGVVGGAIYAGFAAFLWARRNVNEIISTLLLNFIAFQLLSWLVRGPLQEPRRERAESSQLLPSARWPRLLSDTPLDWDVLLVPGAVVAIAFLLTRTAFGFKVRLTGANLEAARFGGIRTARVAAYALVISGGLAGLAGSSLILAGDSRTLADNFSANFGFQGIVVALLARNSPIAVVPAALLFAALRQGGAFAEVTVGVSESLVQVTLGLVIVLLAGSAFLLERRWRRRTRERVEASSGASILTET